jgi:hypothetical protein
MLDALNPESLDDVSHKIGPNEFSGVRFGELPCITGFFPIARSPVSARDVLGAMEVDSIEI